MKTRKFRCLCLLLLTSTASFALDVPSAIYQVRLGTALTSTRSAEPTSMAGLYSVSPTKGQLDAPLTRLLVKVDRNTRLIDQIIGETELEEEECGIAALRLKERYEKQFAVKFSTLTHQGDEFWFVEQAKVALLVGCENKGKTTLRVTLASLIGQ